MQTRKLIHSSEGKITYLQITGFLLILAGIIYLFFKQLNSSLSGEVVSICFFAIMLGVVFAFPDLLRDSNKGLSTMRIVVLMVINVFCLLALNVGWGHSLNAVGVDQYWLGIIAFTFGAKATQSYFESKLAIANATVSQAQSVGTTMLSADADGCGTIPAVPMEDADLPVSKGGML